MSSGEPRPARRPRAGAAALAVLAALAALPARADTFEGAPATGQIRVHAFKRGLFAAFAHDHDFEVTHWLARAELPAGDPGALALEVSLLADSLRDRERALSEADRRKVDAQTAGPAVLDAGRHPSIVFRSERLALDAGAGPAGHLRGTLHGRLALHGEERPLDVAFEAERAAGAWHVRGHARLKQSDFGIRPFRAVGGTVGVKDEVEVSLDLTLEPVRAR